MVCVSHQIFKVQTLIRHTTHEESCFLFCTLPCGVVILGLSSRKPAFYWSKPREFCRSQFLR